MLGHMPEFPSFLWLNGFPPHGWATLRLSVRDTGCFLLSAVVDSGAGLSAVLWDHTPRGTGHLPVLLDPLSSAEGKPGPSQSLAVVSGESSVATFHRTVSCDLGVPWVFHSLTGANI